MKEKIEELVLNLAAFLLVAVLAVLALAFGALQLAFATLLQAGIAVSAARGVVREYRQGAWRSEALRGRRGPMSSLERMRLLHWAELTGPCQRCGTSDEERYMQEGGWDGSQIAVCNCGHRWLLQAPTEAYLDAIGPVTSGRASVQAAIERCLALMGRPSRQQAHRC